MSSSKSLVILQTSFKAFPSPLSALKMILLTRHLRMKQWRRNVMSDDWTLDAVMTEQFRGLKS